VTPPRNWVPRKDISTYRPWATPRKIERLNEEHRLGFYKFDGLVLIDLDELDAYVEAGRVDPAPPPALRAVPAPARRSRSG